MQGLLRPTRQRAYSMLPLQVFIAKFPSKSIPNMQKSKKLKIKVHQKYEILCSLTVKAQGDKRVHYRSPWNTIFVVYTRFQVLERNNATLQTSQSSEELTGGRERAPLLPQRSLTRRSPALAFRHKYYPLSNEEALELLYLLDSQSLFRGQIFDRFSYFEGHYV